MGQDEKAYAPFPPRVGPVGVWVSDGAAGGAFNDFAVYPVRSAPSFGYV